MDITLLKNFKIVGTILLTMYDLEAIEILKIKSIDLCSLLNLVCVVKLLPIVCLCFSFREITTRDEVIESMSEQLRLVGMISSLLFTVND